MKTPSVNMRRQIEEFCAKIGKDPLLVQASGGNISWKENDTLWIKASGLSLADATKENIFVPVELTMLQGAIKDQNFNITPKVLDETSLKPSIETILHVLCDANVVLHLHPLCILIYMIQKDPLRHLIKLLVELPPWVYVTYHKPGAQLAAAISQQLKSNTKIIFLQNHGVIICAKNINQMDDLLSDLISRLSANLHSFSPYSLNSLNNSRLNLVDGYFAIPGNQAKLVTSVDYFDNLKTFWALYPDHVVFLGERPYCYDSINSFVQYINDGNSRPSLVFIRNIGIFVSESFTSNQREMLQLYIDIITNLSSFDDLNVLSPADVSSLTNWDAELYRLAQSKAKG